MGDINQEWKELRMKNGNFINHLDGELAKIEKEKRLLNEQKEQIFYDPVTCMYFKADAEGIQKLLDKQSECVAKMTADYSALVEENMEIQKQLAGEKAQCENTVENRRRISELSQLVIDLKEEKIDLQKQLYAAKKETDEFIAMYDKAAAEAHQAKVAKDRMGYSNRCMQSKIAKQSNEIKRLTHENIGLVIDIRRHKDMIDKLKQGHWDEMEELQNANARLEYDNFQLKQALGISAKDAEGNFDRGYHRGMDELWDAIRKAQEEHPKVLRDIYGQGCMHDCVSNLSAQDFAKKTIEWEEKQAKDIQIGDEVEILDIYDPDLRGDIGIVVVADSERHYFVAVGPNFESHFDDTDIQDGNVRKTGQHFDSIPLNYFA